MKRMATLTAVSLVMGVGLLTGAAQALETKTVVVDCATQSLQALLDSVPTKPDFAAVLVIKGTCAEDVTLEFFDDVTFMGHPTVGGTISGTLTIVGSRRVVIDDLRVTGPGDGIDGFDGASFTVQNSDISDNDVSGILVWGGSSATIINNTIHDNGVDPLKFGEGIDVIGSSTAWIADNDIQNSLYSGIFVARSSSVFLKGNTINNSGLTTGDCGFDVSRSSAANLRDGNVITNSGWAAICVYRASAFRQGGFTAAGGPPPGEVPDTIVQWGCPQSCVPDTVAVWAAENSSADFRNANITGVISVDVLASFRARNRSITGDIFAFGNSGVQVRNTVSFNGTLFCSTGSFSFGDVPCAP